MVVVHHIFGWSHRFAQCTQSFQRILQLFLSLVQTICQQTGYIFLIVTVKRFGRDNELKRIPYLLIVGEKEEAEGLVSVRAQGEGDKGQMTLEAFRDYMTDLVSHEIDANKMEQKN